MTVEGPRLLMVGLDALPPSLLEAWCDDGTLPNIAALRKDGAYGYVDSVARYLPGATWPTFSAAQHPTVHGIYHFMQWDPETMTFRRPTREWCDYTPFWHRLGEQGVPVVALDVPFCYPKEPPPGVVEAHGWGLHDELASPFSQPRSLLGELSARARSPLRPDVLGPKSESMLRRELDGLLRSVANRVGLIEELTARFEWKLLLAVFSETHRAGHYFWGSRATGEAQGGLRRVARAIDAVVPRLQALAPDGRLVLFSLHGMGPHCDIERFSDGLSAYYEPSTLAPSRRFDPVGLLHRNLPRGVRRAMSAMLSTRLRDRLFSHYLGAGQDWRQVKTIFLPPDINLNVRLNLAGRERDGAVTAEDAEEHVRSLTASLGAIWSANGEPAVAEVARLAEVYARGPRSHLLPDLVVRPDQSLEGDLLRLADGRELHVPWRDGRDGTHRETGFFIRTGPGAAEGVERIAEEDFARAMCATVGLSF